MTEFIRQSREGAVVVITMTNPGKYNAFNLQMRDEMIAVFTALQTDATCRAIVLTGEGADFSAGGDLKGMDHQSINETRARLKVGSNTLMRLMIAGAKPVIAAVEGKAIGAGVSLAAACDYVVAARNAQLTCAFMKMAFIPDLAGLWSIPRRVGMGMARKLIMLSRKVDAVEAERIGLIDQVAEAGQALVEAMKIAAEFAAQAPLGIEYIKASMADGLEGVLKEEVDFQSYLLLTHDHAEAKAAFFEKRAPRFNGT